MTQEMNEINIPLLPIKNDQITNEIQSKLISTLPQKWTLWSAAQAGSLEQLTLLISSKEYTVDEKDPEGCSALHWASINKHLPCIKFLIESGAQVNILGGNLSATPLQWAVRSGHIQVSCYLINHGADPTIYDSQGYNCLHIAVHSGSMMMLLYLLAIGMDVDSKDKMGRTALMWASYQNNGNQMVDIILNYNPDLNLQDSSGFTAIHWSIVSSHFDCAKSIYHKRADVNIVDLEGKSAKDWACERGHLKHYNTFVKPLDYSMNDKYDMKTTYKLIHITSLLIIPLAVFIMSYFIWYIGIPLALVNTFLIIQFVIGKYLLNGQLGLLPKTQFMGAIPQSSLLMGLGTWLIIFLSAKNSVSLLTHFIFFISCITSIYCLYKTGAVDPGIVSRELSDIDRRNIVTNLADLNELDTRNFCWTCNIRKPLRSKHCVYCNVCIAKFDHHCPWTSNCIGAKNHRYFMIFVATLIIGIAFYIYIVMDYLIESAKLLNPNSLKGLEQCAFNTELCKYLYINSPALICVIMFSFHLMWTMALFVMQSVQIGQALTTNEKSNAYRLEYLGGNGLDSHHHHDHGSHGHDHEHNEMFNPFDFGVLTNCFDFWKNSNSKGLNWFTLYRVPIELLYPRQRTMNQNYNV